MPAYEFAPELDRMVVHSHSSSTNLSHEEIHLALEQILRSNVFFRARRMCRLLRYLVEQGIAGSRRNTCEYAIALEVFDRNPADYYPASDPVVRIQVGRLRQRLAQFYACYPNQVKVNFSIPVGTYWPVFKRVEFGSVRTSAALGQDAISLPNELYRDAQHQFSVAY